MTERQPDFIRQMPKDLQPSNLQPNVQAQKRVDLKVREMLPKKKMTLGKKISWIVVIVIVIVALVQFFSAAKYPALVQVISQDRIGVNPTGNALDFGDLPRDKSAIRTVNLVSKGNIGSYIIVWKLGSISDLMTVDKNYFTLKPHTTQQLQFTTYIPNSASYQYYRGEVVIFQIPKVW